MYCRNICPLQPGGSKRQIQYGKNHIATPVKSSHPSITRMIRQIPNVREQSGASGHTVGKIRAIMLLKAIMLD